MLKTGRNDPCPCGSGKKYKFCCLIGSVDREAVDIKREASFHADIGDEIVEMFMVDEHLYVVCKNSIKEFIVPDQHDPDRKNIHTKGTIRDISNKGMNDWVISRTLGQAFSLFKGNGMNNSIAQIVFYHMFNFIEYFNSSFNILENLNQELQIKTNDYMMQLSHENKAIFVNTPFISNLKSNAEQFFLNIQKCLKSILDMINRIVFTQETMSFTKFENLDDNHPFKGLIANYFDTLDFLWNIRNAIEHPKSPNKFVVHNIESDAYNKLIAPSYEFSYPSWNKQQIDNNKKYCLLSDMQQYINNTVKFVEDTLLHITCCELDKMSFLSYQIEINEEEAAPMRYSIQLYPPHISS